MMMMKSLLVSLFAFSALALGQLQVNTPSNVVECQPILLTWSGGTSPYFLSVHDGSQPNGSPILSFTPQTGTSLTWNVNVTQSSLGLDLRDSTGTNAQSGNFPINGGNSDCIGGSSGAGSQTSGGSSSPSTVGQTSSGSTPASTSSTTATSTNPSGTSTSASRPSGTSSGTGTSTGSSSASSPSTSNAAATQAAHLGAAGVIGAAVIALLA